MEWLEVKLFSNIRGRMQRVCSNYGIGPLTSGLLWPEHRFCINKLFRENLQVVRALLRREQQLASFEIKRLSIEHFLKRESSFVYKLFLGYHRMCHLVLNHRNAQFSLRNRYLNKSSGPLVKKNLKNVM